MRTMKDLESPLYVLCSLTRFMVRSLERKTSSTERRHRKYRQIICMPHRPSCCDSGEVMKNTANEIAAVSSTKSTDIPPDMVAKGNEARIPIRRKPSNSS